MTSNQIAYWQLQNEKQRTAIQRDAHLENVRHNQTTELETSRHNRATEGVAWFTAQEDARHNLASEIEANRHNLSTEAQAVRNWQEDVRHNNRTEQTQLYSAKSTAELNAEKVNTEQSTQFKNYTYGTEKITKSVSNVLDIAEEVGETISSIATIAKFAGVL